MSKKIIIFILVAMLLSGCVATPPADITPSTEASAVVSNEAATPEATVEPSPTPAISPSPEKTQKPTSTPEPINLFKGIDGLVKDLPDLKIRDEEKASLAIFSEFFDSIDQRDYIYAASLATDLISSDWIEEAAGMDIVFHGVDGATMDRFGYLCGYALITVRNKSEKETGVVKYIISYDGEKPVIESLEADEEDAHDTDELSAKLEKRLNTSNAVELFDFPVREATVERVTLTDEDLPFEVSYDKLYGWYDSYESSYYISASYEYFDYYEETDYFAAISIETTYSYGSEYSIEDLLDDYFSQSGFTDDVKTEKRKIDGYETDYVTFALKEEYYGYTDVIAEMYVIPTDKEDKNSEIIIIGIMYTKDSIEKVGSSIDEWIKSIKIVFPEETDTEETQKSR